MCKISILFTSFRSNSQRKSTSDFEHNLHLCQRHEIRAFEMRVSICESYETANS
jgi:hypothetical protein